MILGFKQQFVHKILNGTKIHTIREDKKDRWKAGISIHFATGVRTKNYNQFWSGECKSVQKIEICHSIGWVTVHVDGRFLGEVEHHGLDDIYGWTDDLLQFAKNDGFENLEGFFEWFDSDFTGKIIHWTSRIY